ncbi:hypothetical protein LEMLEM_LOCUS25854, partial [Lemmus lemmus]
PEGPAQQLWSSETWEAAARAAPPAATRERVPEPTCRPSSQRRREALRPAMLVPGLVGPPRPARRKAETITENRVERKQESSKEWSVAGPLNRNIVSLKELLRLSGFPQKRSQYTML